MNCEQFENLLADELGGELDPARRVAFEQHKAHCAACRSEHASLLGTVGRLSSLPAAAGMRVERVGDQLILAPALLNARRGSFQVSKLIGWLRIAAGVAFAFMAGYAAHGLRPSGAPTIVTPTASSNSPTPVRTLQSAVALQYARNPGRSDLAKGLLAMYESR